MMLEDHQISLLRGEIEAGLNWGGAGEWSNKDFEDLSDRIAQKTAVTLSPTTLKRVWGRVAYSSRPSITTLDALAFFAGHEGWRGFRTTADPEPRGQLEQAGIQSTAPVQAEPVAPAPDSTAASEQGGRKIFVVLVGLGTLLILALLLNHFLAPAAAPKNKTEINPDDYYFNFHPVTTGVPNSVVFTYNAEKAPTEEVYLQQSWDSRRREKLPRNRQSHTSIYYLPGFYQTKLVVDEQVVRERELYLKSEAWIAAVKTEEVPIYLPLEECLRDGRLAVSANQLTELGLELQPTPPRTVLTHVGALENLSSDNFRFSTRLRHDYAAGAGICQYAKVLLLLKNSVIIIPLSAPGCVAELELYAGGQWLKGSENDLSAFGVVGDTWLDLACEGIDGLLTFSVNGRQVFQLESIEDAREIIGIRYEFAGVGSVDELTFSRGSEVVWAEGFDEMEASSF